MGIKFNCDAHKNYRSSLFYFTRALFVLVRVRFFCREMWIKTIPLAQSNEGDVFYREKLLLCAAFDDDIIYGNYVGGVDIVIAVDVGIVSVIAAVWAKLF